MDTDATLLLVGGTDAMVDKARALGLRVLVMQHPERISEAPCARADLVRVVDYTDLAAVEQVARELHESVGFTAAVSLTEPSLEGAGLVNDLFGLSGTGLEVVRRMRDKLAMRRVLAGSGLATVAAAPLATRADFDAFAALPGYPFIVKPVDGTASYGVIRVDGPGAADGVLERVAAMRGHRMDRGSIPFPVGDFLVEEYVEGPEFSLECFSFAGRHVVVSITEKFVSPDHFAELGHAMPARLDAAAEASLRETAARFLDAIGLRDGPSHTEVRLSARGPVVIEAHNRIGGGLIAELVRGAYDLDLVRYAIGWPFRLVPELPDMPVAHRGACTLALVGEPGQVESVTGAPEALAEPDVLAVQVRTKPGDAVRAVRDNWDRLGLLAATGADTTAAVRRGEELLRDTFRILVRGTDGLIRPAHVAAAPGHPQVPVPAGAG